MEVCGQGVALGHPDDRGLYGVGAGRDDDHSPGWGGVLGAGGWTPVRRSACVRSAQAQTGPQALADGTVAFRVEPANANTQTGFVASAHVIA